jgi:hypothetical protein
MVLMTKKLTYSHTEKTFRLGFQSKPSRHNLNFAQLTSGAIKRIVNTVLSNTILTLLCLLSFLLHQTLASWAEFKIEQNLRQTT